MNAAPTVERMQLLVRTVASNLGRVEAEGGNDLVIFHVLYPFRLEFAKSHVGQNMEFRPENINLTEFELLVEIFRRLARRMPDVFRLDEEPIAPTDFSGKVIGWHSIDNYKKYWQPGSDTPPDPFDIATREVLTEHGIA